MVPPVARETVGERLTGCLGLLISGVVGRLKGAAFLIGCLVLLALVGAGLMLLGVDEPTARVVAVVIVGVPFLVLAVLGVRKEHAQWRRNRERRNALVGHLAYCERCDRITSKSSGACQFCGAMLPRNT
jgi:hypothetical protein